MVPSGMSKTPSERCRRLAMIAYPWAGPVSPTVTSSSRSKCPRMSIPRKLGMEHGGVNCGLGGSADLVGEKREVVTDCPGPEQAKGNLACGVVEEALASSEHDRVDHQPKLVGDVALDQRAYELKAG